MTKWHKGQGNGAGSIFADDGRMRCENGATVLYPICTMVKGWNSEEDEANEDLIAAAPELLAELEKAHRFLRKNGYDMESIDAVIAKAKGDEA